MDSPVALLRFVQADARKVVLSRREDTDGGRSIPVDEERLAPDRRVTSQFGSQVCAAGPVKLPD